LIRIAIAIEGSAVSVEAIRQGLDFVRGGRGRGARSVVATAVFGHLIWAVGRGVGVASASATAGGESRIIIVDVVGFFFFVIIVVIAGGELVVIV
jgi:hypothetical protein